MNETKKVYTLTEVARLLDMTTHRVLSMVRKKQIPNPIIHTESTIRFRKSDIDKMLGGTE